MNPADRFHVILLATFNMHTPITSTDAFLDLSHSYHASLTFVLIASVLLGFVGWFAGDRCFVEEVKPPQTFLHFFR